MSVTPGGKKTERVVIWLSLEQKAELAALAEQDDRELSDYCRTVLRAHLQRVAQSANASPHGDASSVVPIGNPMSRREK